MKRIIISLSLVCALQVHAQQAITSAGAGGDDIVWTLGDIVVNTIGSGNNTGTATQGFIQPEYYNATGILNIAGSLKISAYPNPVTDRLTLDFQDATVYTWTLYGLDGKKLEAGQSDDDATSIDFSGYPAGKYLLNLRSEHITQSIVIIKN
jgi:hypothetical protein